MKKLISAIITFMVVATTTYAQETYTVYFEADDLPNGVVWLPEPPDTTCRDKEREENSAEITLSERTESKRVCRFFLTHPLCDI